MQITKFTAKINQAIEQPGRTLALYYNGYFKLKVSYSHSHDNDISARKDDYQKWDWHFDMNHWSISFTYKGNWRGLHDVTFEKVEYPVTIRFDEYSDYLGAVEFFKGHLA